MKLPLEFNSVPDNRNLLRVLLFEPDEFNYDIAKLIFTNTGKAARNNADAQLEYFVKNAFGAIGYDDVTEMDITVLILLFEFDADINKVMPFILLMDDSEKKNQMITVLFQALNIVKSKYKEQLDENTIMKDCLLSGSFVEKPLVGHIVSYINSYSNC